MSDRARELAKQVNQQEETQERTADLQIHRQKVLDAKANAYWQQCLREIEAELNDFNDTLRQESPNRIEVEQKRGNLIRLNRPSDRAWANASLGLNNRIIELTGQSKQKRQDSDKLHKTIALNVDANDMIYLTDSSNPYSENDLAIDLIKVFAKI
jgi:hypothetical protein